VSASNILLLIFFCSVIEGIAQTDSSKIVYSLSGKVGYNSIWASHESQQFTKDHPWSVQIDWGILKNSQRAWNYCNCYSENGVSLSYIDFGNPEKLGKAITIAVFAQPYLLLKKRFQISLRGSAGLAFLSKVYDSITNKEAIFFSTKTSFILGLGVNFSWRLDKNWKVVTSAQFNHISNGGIKDPNEGLNFPGVTIGINYALNPKPLERRSKEEFKNKTTSLVVHGFGNVRTAWPEGYWPEETRLVIGTNIGVIKRLGRIDGIGVGGEYYYDGINEVYSQRYDELIQTTVASVSIQNYLFFGKLLFGQQFAWYVTPNTGFHKKTYQRYILEYEVKRNWYAGVTLKAHGDRSDYIAVSTGYFFRL
jgi:hypothetical protein